MPIKMKNLPVTERPYEKLEQYGEKNLTNAELLAIIIKSGTREETSVQLAQKILLLNENQDKNNLNFLREITIEELIMIKNSFSPFLPNVFYILSTPNFEKILI